MGALRGFLCGLGAVLVSPYSPSGLVTKPPAKPPPSQDSPKPYLNSLHFSSRFLLRLGSLLGSSWLPLGLHLGSLLGSILAQLRPKSPLDTLLFQKREFSRNLTFSNNKITKNDPKTAPKTTQDRPKTAPRRYSRASFFDFVFDIDFDSSWVPF